MYWDVVYGLCILFVAVSNATDYIKLVYTDMLTSSIVVEMDTAAGTRSLQFVFLLFLAVTIHVFVACQGKSRNRGSWVSLSMSYTSFQVCPFQICISIYDYTQSVCVSNNAMSSSVTIKTANRFNHRI